MGRLLDMMELPAQSDEWKPEHPPSLDGISDLELDFETTGLRWDKGDLPGGCGYALPGGKTGYLAWGHRGFANQHDEGAIKRWFEREVRNKRITNLNARFDNHMAYAWGVDLEAQGNTWSDVGHYAALLDDHRQKFSLASLCEDYLSDERKVVAVNGIQLDPTRMMYYPPSVVSVRAEGDVRQVQKLKHLFWPQLTEQDLQRVRQLEDELIFVTCEMERNGCPLDLEKLQAWEAETQQHLIDIIYQVFRETGLRVNPDSSKDWEKLLKHLKIEVKELTATGRASYKDEVLVRIDNWIVQLVRRAGKIADLRSKYLTKYLKTTLSEGVLKYALHQLRAEKDDWRSGEAGTVSGRYSSTELFDGVGCNIQQVLAVEKQIDKYGPEYIIKELFVPGSGLFLSADAAQIELRIFASYANNPRIIKAYQENPDLKYHNLIWDMLKPHKPDLLYKPLKNLNFAYIYGAGLAKIALMMGFITESQHRALRRKYPDGVPRSEPLLAPALAVVSIYERELPEVRPLLRRASDLAAARGYVRTILGRRCRFPDRQRLHKAFNAVDQGSAADVMKLKLVELHRERKYTGMKLRATVHDQVVGDVPDQEAAERVREVLNAQSLPELKVPIRWDVKTGVHWAACEKEWHERKIA